MIFKGSFCIYLVWKVGWLNKSINDENQKATSPTEPTKRIKILNNSLYPRTLRSIDQTYEKHIHISYDSKNQSRNVQMLRRAKEDITYRHWWKALHRNTLIFAGALSFHKWFHLLADNDSSEQPATQLRKRIYLMKNLYCK